jgi:hypothetical protein
VTAPSRVRFSSLLSSCTFLSRRFFSVATEVTGKEDCSIEVNP